MMTMMATKNFSEIKKQGRNKDFKIWGWRRNKVFWSKYSPMVSSWQSLGVGSRVKTLKKFDLFTSGGQINSLK